MSHCADVERTVESDQLLHPFDSNFDRAVGYIVFEGDHPISILFSEWQQF
ncbi:hypothetical protein SAMD00019534_126220 [Acytostelium subglobosum LB1]|nr:hypothetical protein SAMD00019534_126220 [Acytostelium subglobosum LB1]GAM29446.1 hypothetical protein SAMD00019534_126220 [Acytostelium subglobosum LB1]|eukprot:XP_012747608.1 hypothetical protein SAMD00019534_126220 [Acytostelium subglobosum LB1]